MSDGLVIPPAPTIASKLAEAKAHDPAKFSYPPTLAVEIALGDHTPKKICEAYKISSEEWDRIRVNPLFIADVNARLIELQSEGVSFRMKARLQAEGMLERNWHLVHDEKTPPNVAADLIKHTIRMAGLDASKDQAAAAAGAAIGTALQINLHLG